jgi:selenocysteine-specific elongation factor
VAVRPGGKAFARIRLEAPAVLTRNDLVVLRAYSPLSTVGGGRVLDPSPPSGGVRHAASLERFLALDTDDVPAALWLRESSTRGIERGMLIRRGGLSPRAADRTLEALVDDGRAVRAGGAVYDAERLDGIARAACSALAEFHEMHPLEAGMPRESLREHVARGGAQELFDTVVASLESTGAIKGTDRLALTSHQPTLSDEEVRFRERLETTARQAGLRALDAAGLAAGAGATRSQTDAVVTWMVREGRLVRVDAMLVHVEALDVLKRTVRELGRSQASEPVELDVAGFKAKYGLTRKHAIPLLEWLDRERVTRRVGNTRQIVS